MRFFIPLIPPAFGPGRPAGKTIVYIIAKPVRLSKQAAAGENFTGRSPASFLGVSGVSWAFLGKFFKFGSVDIYKLPC
jgi:hypothetical protein